MACPIVPLSALPTVYPPHLSRTDHANEHPLESVRSRYALKRFGSLCVAQPILGGGATLTLIALFALFLFYVRKPYSAMNNLAPRVTRPTRFLRVHVGSDSDLFVRN